MPPVPRRSQTADEVANQRVDAILNPQLEAEQRAYEEAQRQAYEQWVREQQSIQGYAQAAASMAAPIAGQVQGGYQQAADFQKTLGQAFSAGFRDAVNGTASQANALLAQQGSPQQVTSAGVPGGDVLFGTGGFIPASTLSREGAAFGAAAAMLPATFMGQGQQMIGQGQREFDESAAARRREYENARRGIEGQRASLYQQERQNIFERNFAREQFAEEKRQARINAQIQWHSVKGTLAAYGLDEKKLLQAEAEFMTNQTGVIHKVKYDKKGNGRVVATGQPAPGSAAASNVAAAAGDSAKTAADRAAARKTALANRSEALTTASGALREASGDWAGKPIENPKPGSLLNPGKYLDRNGKGTNDLSKAAREGGLTWSQMVNRAMQMEEVQQLMTRYGLSRAKARARVVAWLRSFGFRPPASPKQTVRVRPDKGKPTRG
jgi:hypothetical protein